MSEGKGSPIRCEDKDGNPYTVMAGQDLVAGNNLSDDLKNPVWYLSLDRKSLRVIGDTDPETGKLFFVCPALDDLKLFPKD